MKYIAKMLLPILSLSLSLTSFALAEAPVAQDFAYAANLRVDGDGAIYKLSLPEQVYRTVTRTDLGDIRVFNSANTAVPHMLRKPLRQRKEEVEQMSVPHFPLYGTQKNNKSPLSVHVATNDKGAIVNIDSGAVPVTQEKVTGYLLDLSQVKRKPNKLVFQWLQPSATDDSADENNFITSVTVQYSSDLNRWNTLIRKATLANMMYAEHRLDRHVIELPARKAKYLRITWRDKNTILPIRTVSLGFANGYEQLPWRWNNVAGVVDKEDRKVYEFDTQASFPVERMRIRLPQRNTLVRARLLSRANTEQEWRYRYSGDIYQLMISGNELNSHDIRINAVSDRYWRLEIQGDDTHLGNGLPMLSAGWLPHTMLFVAQGEGPFKLAYGSSATKPVDISVHNLVSRIERQQQKNRINNLSWIRTAQVTDIYTLGGPSRLRPMSKEWPWKKMLLWSVLVLVVIILSFMARQLYRQMQDTPESVTDDTAENKDSVSQ